MPSSKSIWYCFYDESAYAAGTGTNAYNEAVLNSTTGVKSAPATGKVTFPVEWFDYQPQFRVGDGLLPTRTGAEKVKYNDPSIQAWIIDSDFIKWTCYNQSNTIASHGDIPKSRLLHYEIPINETEWKAYDAFGVVAKKYELSVDPEKVPTQTVTLQHRKTKESYDLDEVSLVAHPKVGPGGFRISYSFDNSNFTEMNLLSFKMTIENDYGPQIEISDPYRKAPHIKSRKVEVELSFQDSCKTWIDRVNSGIPCHIALKIQGFNEVGNLCYGVTLQGMLITDLNYAETPDPAGLYKYTMKLTMSKGSHGYEYLDITSPTTLYETNQVNSSETYDFNIQIDNDSTQTNVSVALSTSDTLQNVIDKINQALVSNNVNARCVWNEGTLYFFSGTQGSQSKVTLFDGTNNLFSALSHFNRNSQNSVNGHDGLISIWE